MCRVCGLSSDLLNCFQRAAKYASRRSADLWAKLQFPLYVYYDRDRSTYPSAWIIKPVLSCLFDKIGQPSQVVDNGVK